MTTAVELLDIMAAPGGLPGKVEVSAQVCLAERAQRAATWQRLPACPPVSLPSHRRQLAQGTSR